jgi:hypothetical protein
MSLKTTSYAFFAAVSEALMLLCPHASIVRIIVATENGDALLAAHTLVLPIPSNMPPPQAPHTLDLHTDLNPFYQRQKKKQFSFNPGRDIFTLTLTLSNLSPLILFSILRYPLPPPRSN